MTVFRQPTDHRLARYDHFICHVTATKLSQKISDHWIDRVHRARGFSGTGYHLLIDQRGDVFTADKGNRMRPFDVPGAHVGGCGPGWNNRSFGLVLEGGLDEETGKPTNTMTAEQIYMLEQICIQFAAAHPNPQNIKWLGHRDLIRLTNAAPKACPCFDFPEFVQRSNIMDQVYSRSMEDANSKSDMDIEGVHVVRPGETLWGIARKYHTSISRIKDHNPEISGTIIFKGQEIKIR